MNDQHPIIQKLSDIRRAEATWLRVFSISLFAFIAITAIVAACVLDYAFRFESHVTRAMLLYCVIAIVGFAAIKLLWPSLFFKRKHVEIAKRIEILEPAKFGNRLSLATGFLIDPTSNGSLSLRNQVVDAAELDLKDRQFPTLLCTSSPKRAIAMLLAILVIVSGLFAVKPNESLFATQRFFQPLATNDWPSLNQLQFEELPQKIAAGELLDLIVTDQNSRLPARVFLQIDDGSSIRKREMRKVDQTMKYQIANASTSFKVRAVGGDGATDWMSITVIQPPEVSDISLTVSPPQYSGLPTGETSMFQKVWFGSEISIRGTSEKAFDMATVIFIKNDTRVPSKRSGSQFVFPSTGRLKMTDSLDFRIELADKEGIAGGKKQVFRIPVRKDEPPFANLKFDSPRELYSTDDQIDFEIVASDDMKIIAVEYIVTVDGKRILEKPMPVQAHVARTADRNDRIELNISETVRLSAFPELAEKSEFSVHIKVVDANGSVTESPAMTARIGTEQQIKNLQTRNKNQIFDLISEALNAQNDSLNLVQVSIEEIKRNESNSVASRLGRAVTQQQNVDDILYGSSGVIELSNRFNEQINDAEFGSELVELVVKVNSLRQKLDDSKNFLLDSVAETDPNARLSKLTSASTKQTEIVDILQSLVGMIGEEQQRQGYLADLTNLNNRERTIVKELQTIQAVMLRSNSINENQDSTLAENRVSVERILNEQIAINKRFAELAWSAKKAADSYNSTAMLKLYEKVKSVEVLGNTAAKRLQNSQIGLALSEIQAIIELLDRLLNQVPKPLTGSGLTKEQIGESKSQLSSLQSNQDEIAKQLSNWSKLSDAEKTMLLDAIENQRTNTQTFQEQYGQQLSETANQKLQQTSELLGDAKSDLKNNDVQAAKQKLDEASQNLKTVGEELDAKSDAAERNERNEQFRQFQQTFQNWLEIETGISKQLDQIGLDDSNNTNRIAILAEIITTQESLGRQFETLLPKDADFFVLQNQLTTLSAISRSLVEELKANNLTDANTSVQNLIKRLQQLASSKIESEPPTEDEQKPNSNKQQDTPPKSGIAISEFEVQLLRLLQEEILVETEAINQLKANSKGGRDAAKIKKRSLELSEKQGELISTINQYLGPESPKSESNDTVPEIPPISEIPDIGLPDNDIPKIQFPEMDLSNLDQKDNNVSDSEFWGNEPSECSFVQQETRIETLSPLAKQGEDIGEKSDETKNRLQQVRDKMLKVQELLIQQKLSSENKTLQKEIIEDLKLFVTDQKKKSQKSSNKNNKPKDDKKGQNAATTSQTNSEKEKPNEQNGNISKTQGENELAQRLERIWGHLPEHLKENDLNIRSPKYLPKYRELIQNYFKRLAKENASN